MYISRDTPDDQLLKAVDLSVLEHGEARVHEVAIVTKFKAPELLSTYNLAHLTAQKARGILHTRVAELEAQLEALAAVIALERAPVKLKELGVLSPRSPGGSEDQRQAVVQSDPEYRALKERILDLKAGVEEFTIRARSMEKAFSAVKAIYMDRDLPNPNLHNPVDKPPEAQPTPQRRGGFGAPRFNT